MMHGHSAEQELIIEIHMNGFGHKFSFFLNPQTNEYLSFVDDSVNV